MEMKQLIHNQEWDLYSLVLKVGSCAGLCVFPQKEMKMLCSTLFTPFGVLEYALITFCTYREGAEMSPFELAVFLSHILTNVWVHQVS